MFRYGLVNRPACFGAVPKGSFKIEPPLDGETGQRYTRHGIIIFERELTEDEIYNFELSRLADVDFVEQISFEVSVELSDYAGQCIELQQTDPLEFSRMVMDCVKRSRKYLVHIGDTSSFVEKIAQKLKLCCFLHKVTS